MQQALRRLQVIWVYLAGQIYPLLLFVLLPATVHAQPMAENGKVPRIDIDIENGHTVVSRNYYLDAKFRITGYGTFKDFGNLVQIKGRGNNSWNYEKKSYRLKFPKEVKPFGLTEGKNWVLQANPQHGSLMVNAIAMKIGQLANVPYCNHVIPVELYINGEYQGSYIFTEKVGLGNNSVNIDEELAYMLELDSYYDEIFKFRSASSDLPVNIKEPDLQEFETGTVSSSVLQSFLNDNCKNTIPAQNLPNSSLTATVIANYNARNAIFNVIKEQFNRLDSIVCNNGDIGRVLDLDAAARYVLVNDLVFNREILHPKSVFLWKADITSPCSKFILGPIWDFDYAFGYTGESYFTAVTEKNCIVDGVYPGCRFFTALINNREFQRHYYKVWCEFVEKDCIDEVMEYIGDYYSFIKESYGNNAQRWGDNTDYAGLVPQMQQWIKKRHDHIFSNLTVYDISDLDNDDARSSKEQHTGIYTIYGKRVIESDNLQQGLYIINGKKVFIRRKQ